MSYFLFNWSDAQVYDGNSLSPGSSSDVNSSSNNADKPKSGEVVPKYPRSYEEDEDIFGVDMDVIEMQMDDKLDEQSECSIYGTYEYLQECRKRLMDKVSRYRV